MEAVQVPIFKNKRRLAISTRHENVFFSIVMLFSSKWPYFIAFLLGSLSKTSAMRYSVVTAENLAGTTSPISLFNFPATFGEKINSQLL